MAADATLMSLNEHGLTYRLIAESLPVSQRRISRVIWDGWAELWQGVDSDKLGNQSVCGNESAGRCKATDLQMSSVVHSTFGTIFKRLTMTRSRNALCTPYRPLLRVQALTQQRDYSMQRAMLTRQAMKAALGTGRSMGIVFTERVGLLPTESRWSRYRCGQWSQAALRMMKKFPWGRWCGRRESDGSRHKSPHALGLGLDTLGKGPPSVAEGGVLYGSGARASLTGACLDCQL
jgi:hypothetical protein